LYKRELSREDALGLKNLLFALGNALPATAVVWMLRLALGAEGRIALCLHRVGGRRPHALVPEMTIAGERLEDLLELLAPLGRRVTAAFDDGYADAARWLEANAARFPEVEWLSFLCPHKTEAGAGFRWDLHEKLAARGETEAASTADLGKAGALDWESERRRDDLAGLGGEPAFELADIDTWRRLARERGVVLGNHTNGHFQLTAMPPDAAAAELERSTRDFERLFGPMTQFAFPFGTPGVEVGPEHVAMLRRIAPRCTQWSTEARPYSRAERESGALLPRYPVDGTWPAKQTIWWMALLAAKWRWRQRAAFS
jgi:peptidoglycan/xylan/chitin deacetylase (PgdA/CDA1 family)